MAFIYLFIPNALAPLAALLCAGGMVRDDVEEQTLTYLLIRPLPRSALYLVKLMSSTIVAIALTVFFSAATFVLIESLAGPKLRDPDLAEKVVRLAMIFGVTQFAYCALFGIMGLVMRWSLVVGVAYIALLEGFLAAFNTMARQLTVVFYFRVLVVHWLHPTDSSLWSIDAAKVPSAKNCIVTLLIAASILTAIGSLILSVREFRMKTPEGE